MRLRLLLIGLTLLWGCSRAKHKQVAAVSVPVVPMQAESEPIESAELVMQTQIDSVHSTIPSSPEVSTFWQQAQRLYGQAKSSGSTTASSAAAWVADLYDTTSTSSQNAAWSSADWVSEKYRDAVAAGETSATSAKDWVLEDLGKIGTWSYRVVEINSDKPELLERELNTLGAQRWECFTVRPESHRTILCLKRPHRSYLRYLPAKDLLRLVPLIQGANEATE